MLQQATQPLITGERLSREEFLRRWEAQPELKYAELIGGVVYLSSPVTMNHWSSTVAATRWLDEYADETPGCQAGANGTWLMAEDCPQPDVFLRILPEYGGQSWNEGGYVAGAPEFIIEIATSTAAKDLGPKRDLHEAAKVREYVAVLTEKPAVRWFRWQEGRYVEAVPDADGIFRSSVFPGLWLDPAALLRNDRPRLMKVLRQGIESAAHRDFVAALARRKAGPVS